MAENEDGMGPSTSSQGQPDDSMEGEEIIIKVEITSPPPSPSEPCTDFPESMACDPIAEYDTEAKLFQSPPSPESILGNITEGQGSSKTLNSVVKKEIITSKKREVSRSSALMFAKRNVLTDKGLEKMMSLLSDSSGKVTRNVEPTFRRRFVYRKVLEEKLSPETIKASLKPKYTCHQCNKVFDLDRHLRSHNAICNPNALECDVCGENMGDVITLEQHKAKGKCGTCKECGKEFTEATVFKAHKLLAHAEGATFKCSICKVSFKQVFSLTNHIRKVHSKKSLECNSCGLYLPDQDSLAEHQRNNTCARCAKCGTVFTDLSSFRAHMLSKHNSKDPCICITCNKQFSSVSVLNQHNRKFHPPKIYDCSTCGMILPDEESHKQHEAEQSCVKCYDCGKEFESNCALKKHHLLSHPVDKLHKCTMCTRSFDKENALIWHLRNVHKEANPYVCQICGHRSPFRPKLKAHMRTHKMKRFACTECDMRFVTGFVLKTHMLRVHEQNRPFACTQCPKKFAAKAFLTEHINHAHNPARALKWQVRLESISNEDPV